MGSRSWWRSRRSTPKPGPAPTPAPDSNLKPEPGLELQAGQVWRYRTRPGEEQSRVQILVLEQHPELGELVHIRVDGVQIPNPVVPERPNTVLGHVPIEGAAFRRSVIDLVATDPQEPDLDGYRQWRDAAGGVFGLPIAEAVAAVEATLTGATYTAWIDDNVQLAFDALAPHVDFEMGLDRRSLVWIEGFLERQRAHPEFDARDLVPVIGSFLGQCLVEHGRGQWRQDGDGWLVHLPGVDARPFDKVDKQARHGRGGGESIVGFFDIVLDLNARYDHHRD